MNMAYRLVHFRRVTWRVSYMEDIEDAVYIIQ